jgi:hypothetical protein
VWIELRGIQEQVETLSGGFDAILGMEAVERPNYLVSAQLVTHALDPDVTDRPAINLVFDQRICGVRDLYLVRPGGLFQSRRDVDRSPDDGVVEPVLRAEVAHRAVTGIDPKSDVKWLRADHIRPRVAQLPCPLSHPDSHSNTSDCIFFATPRLRISKEDHYPVANEFVDSSPALVGDP